MTFLCATFAGTDSPAAMVKHAAALVCAAVLFVAAAQVCSVTWSVSFFVRAEGPMYSRALYFLNLELVRVARNLHLRERVSCWHVIGARRSTLLTSVSMQARISELSACLGNEGTCDVPTRLGTHLAYAISKAVEPLSKWPQCLRSRFTINPCLGTDNNSQLVNGLCRGGPNLSHGNHLSF